MPWGVGVIGAGPGVAALHLPTLAMMGDLFRVVHVSDHGSGRAVELAARLGATASHDTAELLADPAVEVVVICSPPDEHARQILECVAAGVRAILCEKPLATTREAAREVVDACRQAGIPILVATNHFYDEAWDRTKHHLLALESDVRSISATVALPPNGRYHAAVTELVASAAPPRSGARPHGPRDGSGRRPAAGARARRARPPGRPRSRTRLRGRRLRRRSASARLHGRLPFQRRSRPADGRHAARRPRSDVAAHGRHLDRPDRRRVPAGVRARGQRHRPRPPWRPAVDDVSARRRRRLRPRVAGTGRDPRRRRP